MAEQAHVTSIDALESFRASLIVFINRAHTRIDEVKDEVRRTRSWLQSDRRVFWDLEVRKRRRVLDQAEQELMTARMSGLRDSQTLQLMAVRKAQAAVDEAETKLRNVKSWLRIYDSRVDPIVRRLESLRNVLDSDLPKAISLLLQTQKALEDYAAIGQPTGLASPKPPEPGEGTP